MPADLSFAARLRAGPPALAAWCGLPDPMTAGLLAREDFDAVVLDMQHGAMTHDALVRALPLVAAAGKPALARIPVGEFATASRLLDAGAAAVIAPMINSKEDACRFASFMKYPPDGVRSWGPHGALTLTGLGPADYCRAANGLCLSFAMVETREALAAADEILAVPGIDGIFLGPSDLALALSGGASLDPESAAVEQALDHALARARAADKLAGIYAVSGERAAVLSRRGYHLVAMASDTAFLRLGAQIVLSAARG